MDILDELGENLSVNLKPLVAILLVLGKLLLNVLQKFGFGRHRG